MKKSSIQLVNYFFKKLLVEWKDGPKEPKNIGKLNINYKVFVNNKESDLYRLDFLLQRTPQDDFGGLNMDIRMEGFFSFPKETPEEEIQKMIRLNGCTILFSTLRGHISSITSSFPDGRITLPSIVMLDLVTKIEKERIARREKVSTSDSSGTSI